MQPRNNTTREHLPLLLQDEEAAPVSPVLKIIIWKIRVFHLKITSYNIIKGCEYTVTRISEVSEVSEDTISECWNSNLISRQEEAEGGVTSYIYQTSWYIYSIFKGSLFWRTPILSDNYFNYIFISHALELNFQFSCYLKLMGILKQSGFRNYFYNYTLCFGLSLHILYL